MLHLGNFISKSWKVKDRKQVFVALIVFQFDLFSESSHKSQCWYSWSWSCSAEGVGNFTSDFTVNRNKLQVNKNYSCVRVYKIRSSRAETVNFVCTAQYGRYSSCCTKKIQKSWRLYATQYRCAAILTKQRVSAHTGKTSSMKRSVWLLKCTWEVIISDQKISKLNTCTFFGQMAFSVPLSILPCLTTCIDGFFLCCHGDEVPVPTNPEDKEK